MMNCLTRWLDAMTSKYLPNVTDGEIIINSQLHLVDMKDDENSYAVQFSFADTNTFISHKLSTMNYFLSQLDSEFKGKYVYFVTTLKTIYIHK